MSRKLYKGRGLMDDMKDAEKKIKELEEEIADLKFRLEVSEESKQKLADELVKKTMELERLNF